MSIEIYVEAAMVRKQRGRLVGGIAYIALDADGCIDDEDWEPVGYVTDQAYLDLSALALGLKRARDSDIIYSSSDYCVKGFNEWLDGWKRRDWRKANKESIANAELWRLVDERSAEKRVEVRKVAACSAGKDAAYRYALLATKRQL
ncbi:ribonuclease HI [Vibrio parahaemolyticus]|uniref:RNase H family protein n=1 Tax=Vibrio parahaemolyticus TaxID=670 RepID=UPI0011237FF9|nr:RNase H family protein [Vibrio parahaemolyticus]EGQ8540252.1 ribonuclease HI [Vibrio parahaemolyticus]EIJ2224162.1 ribonuclease HI [Vibrio parahaemolyticus]EJG1842295.1 ribonuclease HI [Vibrio parahaemolyticus]MBE4163999.1 ribonuclease HI [Vibrio parahaemolyticus]MBE4353976.1 ribonuclease HI [Vibrio parahaemolyticus]